MKPTSTLPPKLDSPPKKEAETAFNATWGDQREKLWPGTVKWPVMETPKPQTNSGSADNVYEVLDYDQYRFPTGSACSSTFTFKFGEAQEDKVNLAGKRKRLN